MLEEEEMPFDFVKECDLLTSRSAHDFNKRCQKLFLYNKYFKVVVDNGKVIRFEFLKRIPKSFLTSNLLCNLLVQKKSEYTIMIPILPKEKQ